MSNSPGWYLHQAEIYYQRAGECARVADELGEPKLVDVLDGAGDDTWRCPAAAAFREEVLVAQRNVLEEVDALRTNATGLSDEGDNMSRTTAYLREQEREAARQQAIAAGATVRHR